MSRLIAIFFLFLAICYCGMYWVIESFLVTGDAPMTIAVRVEKDDEPFTGNLHLTDFQGKTQTVRDVNMAYYISWSAVSAFEIASGRPEEVLQRVSAADINRYGSHMTINLNTGAITSGIGFTHYLTGSVQSGGIEWIGMLLLGAGHVFVFLVLPPLGIIAMVYSLIREKAAGIKRRFAGSRFRLVFGIFLVAIVAAFYIAYQLFLDRFMEMSGMEMPPMETTSLPGVPDFVFYIIPAYVLIGYGAYYFACRTFNAEEVRAKMRAKFWADVDAAENFTYTITTWSDGTKTSDYHETRAANYFCLLLKNIFIVFSLPASTYYSMIKYYLIPILNRKTSWGYKLSREEKAEVVSERKRVIAEHRVTASVSAPALPTVPDDEPDVEPTSTAPPPPVPPPPVPVPPPPVPVPPPPPSQMHMLPPVQPSQVHMLPPVPPSSVPVPPPPAPQTVPAVGNRCPSCGAAISGVGRFCAECGTQLR